MKNIKILIKILLFLIIFFSLFFRFYQLNMPDIIEDEDGHVRDAIAFYHKDPSIVPRHHTFKHTVGNIGHPFFHHYLMLISYKIFSPTNASSRLPAAFMSLLSAFFVYLLSRKMFDNKVALVAVSFYLLSPLVFRTSRTAHIDCTFAAMGGISLYFFYSYITKGKLFSAFCAGLFSALLFSSKINGIVIFAVFALFLLIIRINNIYKLGKKDILPIVVFFSVFAIIFFLLNDPGSYIDAVIHPADRGYNTVYTNPLIFNIPRLKGVLLYLFPLHFSLLLFISILVVINRIFTQKSKRKEYILLIIAIVFFFTGFRFGLERGLMIFLIPAAILTAKVVSDYLSFNKLPHLLLYLIIYLLFLPSLIFYGFRTKSLPIPPYDPITHYYNNRLKTADYLNNLPEKEITVSTLPSTFFFPSLNLRKGIEYIPVAFRDYKTTDYFLTDDIEIYKEKLKDTEYSIILYTQYNNDMTALFKRKTSEFNK